MLDETKLQWIGLHRVNHIAVITLKQPDRLNALNREMTHELHSVLDQISEEFPNTRALVLIGSGRGFCSGADVSDISRRLNGNPVSVSSEQSAGPSDIMRLAPHLREIPQPVIAAVNGVAAGAGLGLALSCDIRIGSESARFTSVFVKRSLVPDAGVSQLLGTLVGPGIASEMALTGKVYDSSWALEKGLLNKVVPEEELLDHAKCLATEIAANPPLAVKATKQLMNSHCPDLRNIIELEHSANEAVRGTTDQKEAILAFLEKRKPNFTGQ